MLELTVAPCTHRVGISCNLGMIPVSWESNQRVPERCWVVLSRLSAAQLGRIVQSELVLCSVTL